MDRVVKVLILLALILFCGGCGQQIDYAAVNREHYVNNNVEEIRETSVEISMPIVEKIMLPSMTRQDRELCQRALSEGDYNTFHDIIADFLVNKSGRKLSSTELQELEKIVADGKQKFQQMFQQFDKMVSSVILDGCIIQGMTVKQVEIAWNTDLTLGWSGQGYDTYEARLIRQQDWVLDSGDMKVIMTEPSRACRDFNLTFKNGRLSDWVSYPSIPKY